MKYVFLAVLATMFALPAAAQSVQYPAGTSAAQIAKHEAQRAKAAAFQASLVNNPNCVESADKFTTCDPSLQIRQSWRAGTQTQGGAAAGGAGSGGF